MLTRRSIILLLYLCSLTIVANCQVVADFGASTPTTGCAPLVVKFTNSSTGATSYKWDFGDGTPPRVAVTPSTTYISPGTYTVTLTAYNGTDSSVKVRTAYITVYDVPAVSFSASPTKGCPGTCINFTDGSNLKAPGSGSYLWDFGDGNSSTIQNPIHCFPNSGHYNVSLVVTNSRGCVSTLVKTSFIDIWPGPKAAFSGSPLHFCNPTGTVTFTNASNGGTSPLHYMWRFGDGGTLAATSPSHDYKTYGFFDVTLVVTDTNGCKDSVKKSSYVIVNKPKAIYSGPSIGCINSPITFNNSSGLGVTSQWFFGDGGTANTTDGHHTYSTAGTYTVKLVVNDGTCTDTASQNITISDGPVDSFSYSPKEPCPAPQTIAFTFKGSGASNYSWDFGDGSTPSSSSSPTHTYSSNGVYSVTLTTTGPTGCVSTYSDSVFIRDLQVSIIPYPADKGCAPLTIYFSAGVETTIPAPAIYPYTISSYRWQWGDGTPDGTGPLPSHTYTDTGVYVLHLTVTHNPGGCTASATDTIKVGDHPVASFHPLRDTICKLPPLYFVNTSTHANEYIWDFGDGTGPNFDKNPTHGYGDTGTFHVRMIAKYNGCPDTVYHDVVVLPPIALINWGPQCPEPGDTIKFTDTSSILITSRTWYFEGGDTSILDSPTHIFNSLGSHTVKLVVYNSSTQCSDTATAQIGVLTPRDSVWALTDTAICMYGKVFFKDTMLGSDYGFDYMWFDRPADSLISKPIPGSVGYQTATDTFYIPGYHTITVVARASNECFYQDSLKVLVGKPAAAFKANPLVACIPSTVTFTDTSHDVSGAFIAKRFWTFGNGDTLTTRSNLAYGTYKKRGTDSVKLIVTDNIGCKDSLTKQNFISAVKPIANFYVSDQTPCKFETVYFYNYSKPDTSSVDTLKSYFWTFGDGDTSSTQSPTHIYRDTGSYTVRLIIRDTYGCADTMTRLNFIIIHQPHASFAMDDSTSICPPLHVQFTNTSIGATNYYWDMSDTNSFTITNPGHTFTTSRYYTITLVASDANGCKDTAIGHVNIYGYNGALTYGPRLEGCAPLTVNFTASIVNAPLSVWDFNDGYAFSDTSGSATTSHTYIYPGAYVPKLILSDGKGCKSGSTGLDTIKVDGVIARYHVNVPCIGDTTTFRDSSYSYFSPVTGWYWSLSGGLHSTSNYAVNRYNDTGKYYVNLIVTNANGCKDTLDDSVMIHGLPIIDAGPDTIICIGDAATLKPSGGVNYIWNTDPTLSCTNCTNPKASPSVPTTYTVLGMDVYGCKNTDTVTVRLQTKTTSVLDNGGDICQGDTAHLHASGAQVYSWSPPDSLTNANIADPLAFPMSTTTYIVIAREGSCVPDTNSTVVTVHPKPVISAGNDVTIVGGESTTLQASGSNIISFLWDSTQTLSCLTCSNPVATPTVTTTYTVIGISDFGCKDTADVTVRVKCDKSQVFIPNAFTPNGDGQNDVFFPRGVSISHIKSFRVYDRWGTIVFEKTNININDESSGWDGTFGGTAQPPAVYVYLIDAICESGQEMILKGDVTIIR